jgi:SAM-dependent methyltransferase
MSEYDDLADIYDLWLSADPTAGPSLRFYTQLCLQTPGIVVELGVGTGRIVLQVARGGKAVVGVDLSAEMLARCRARARAEGVEGLVHLIQADVRDFCLEVPAQLILLPLRTLGHLLTPQEKRAALTHIYGQLAPGGELALDHYVLDEEWARAHGGAPRLVVERTDEETGRTTWVWDMYHYDFDAQRIDGLIEVREVEADGTTLRQAQHPLTMSWVRPEQMRALLEDVGFEITALYGGFEGETFDRASRQQVWLARRP